MGGKRATPNHANANQIEEIMSLERNGYRDKFYETMSVNNVPVKFEVDSGAAVTIVSTKTLRQLWPKNKLRPTDLRLITFLKPISTLSGSCLYLYISKT